MFGVVKDAYGDFRPIPDDCFCQAEIFEHRMLREEQIDLEIQLD